MSKLAIDQKSIEGVFSDKKADFVIPDYQRPYAWEEKECQKLWDDIFGFAFPDNDCSKFDSAVDEYFLGPIVTFKNDKGKLEIIDGQQRLTTLMLLLRAFYAKFGSMKDENSIKTKEAIAKCIWKTDEFGNPNLGALKINSEVATDDDKDEFLYILKTGDVKEKAKSYYAKNYRFFEEKIATFLNEFPSYFAYLPNRILRNCILLPIEAESQDTALRIFSTLNDRGKPLSDADIFKAQLYKFYTAQGKKSEFIARWKNLEAKCNSIFHPQNGSPTDEIFTQYMYVERARAKNKQTTTKSLRSFYEEGRYALLGQDTSLSSLEDLASFWEDVANQDVARFSPDVLKRLFVLNYAPNGMWTYFLSVYYSFKRDACGNLDEVALMAFLDRVTAFVWAYAFINPGVNQLRGPIYNEMVNIATGADVSFGDYLFDRKKLLSAIRNFRFSNGKLLTKAMLVWWAFYKKPQQGVLNLETAFEIEHIFARNRQCCEHSLADSGNLEVLGNKSILEKRVNIRAADYRFADKKKYYLGFTTANNKNKEGTKVEELIEMAKNRVDFTESDIVTRNEEIIDGFLGFVTACGLMSV